MTSGDPIVHLLSYSARYFLTIVNDFSRTVWTILLLEKREVPTALKTFFAFVERKFSTKIKSFCSDNGAEFISLCSFFAEQGVFHQISCVETPQQNRHVERKHIHILNMARALFLSKSSHTFLGRKCLDSHIFDKPDSDSSLGQQNTL